MDGVKTIFVISDMKLRKTILKVLVNCVNVRFVWCVYVHWLSQRNKKDRFHTPIKRYTKNEWVCGICCYEPRSYTLSRCAVVVVAFCDGSRVKD